LHVSTAIVRRSSYTMEQGTLINPTNDDEHMGKDHLLITQATKMQPEANSDKNRSESSQI